MKLLCNNMSFYLNKFYLVGGGWGGGGGVGGFELVLKLLK